MPTADFINVGSSANDGTGDALRTVFQHLNTRIKRDAVNVKDAAFGAAGDGTTDDYVALKAALDTGRPVYFPPGTYRTGTFLPGTTNGQVIFGAGPGITSIVADTGVHCFKTQNIQVCLRDMTLGGASSGALAASGIFLGVDGSTYTGHHFRGFNLEFRYAAIGLYNGKFDASGLWGCYFRDNTVNVKSDGNQDYFGLYSCTVNDATGDGIQVVNTGGVLHHGGVCANNGSSGTGFAVNVDSGGSRYTTTGVHFETVANGSSSGVYINLQANAQAAIDNAEFADGSVTYTHIAAAAGVHVSVASGKVYNNANGFNTTSTTTSHITADDESNLAVNYNSGAHNFVAGAYDYGTSLPTADATQNNRLFLLLDSTNDLYWCQKSAGPAYAWINLSTPSGGGGTGTVFAASASGAVNIPSSFANITGLSIANVAAGTYMVEFDGSVFANNPGGWAWKLNASAGTIAAVGRFTETPSWLGSNYFLADSNNVLGGNDITAGESWDGSGSSPSAYVFLAQAYAFHYRGVMTVSATATISVQHMWPEGGGSGGQVMAGTTLKLIKQ